MAADIGSWIANALIQHDKKHGSNFTIPWQGNRYCQIVKFTTYRTPQEPLAQVRGVISDQTHQVLVSFDVNATNEYETSIHGVPAETLTSALRATIQVKAFRFRPLPPAAPAAPAGPRDENSLDLPRLSLEILEWYVVNGDKHDPVFFPDAIEIGTGKSDGDVQKILRKWWAGESFTDHSQAKTTQSPSRSQRHPKISAASAALQPYLFPGEGKKPTKAIPDWLFEVPDDTIREIDGITVWGLDISTRASGASAAYPSPAGSKNASTSLPPGTQITPQELSFSSFHPQAQSTQHRGSQIAGISSLSAPTRPSDDPTGHHLLQPDSSLPRTTISGRSEMWETDEEEMSDYEREKRRAAKGKAKAAAEPQDESPPTPEPSDDQEQASPPAPRPIGASGGSADPSQSLSGSHNSGYDFSLSQFAALGPALTDAENDRLRQEIASMPTPKKSSPVMQSRRAKRSHSPSDNRAPTRSTQESEDGPSKRPKSSPTNSSKQAHVRGTGKDNSSVLASLRSVIGLAQGTPGSCDAASSPATPGLPSTEDRRSFLGKIVDWSLGRSSQPPEEPSAIVVNRSQGDGPLPNFASPVSVVFGRSKANKVVRKYQTAAQRNRGLQRPAPNADEHPSAPFISAYQPDLDDDLMMVEAEEESAFIEEEQYEDSEVHEEGIELGEQMAHAEGMDISGAQPMRADTNTGILDVDVDDGEVADEEESDTGDSVEEGDVGDYWGEEEDQLVDDDGEGSEHDEEDYHENAEDEGPVDTYEAEDEGGGDVDFAEQPEDGGPVDVSEAEEDGDEVDFAEQPEDEGPVDTYEADDAAVTGVTGGLLDQLPDTDDEAADVGNTQLQVGADEADRDKVKRIFGSPKASSAWESSYRTAPSPSMRPKIEPKSTPARAEAVRAPRPPAQNPSRPAHHRSLRGRFDLNLNHPDGLALSMDTVNSMLSRAEGAHQQSIASTKGKGKEIRRF